MTNSFWDGKKVLITGHTGFKGSWLTHYLLKKNANICGISNKPNENPNLFDLLNFDKKIQNNIQNICDYKKTRKIITDFSPEIVIHMAAQALVRIGYENPIETYNSNVMGTVNILNSIRDCNNCKVAIFITTDKVYKDQGRHVPFKEHDELGGHDPYSSSKSVSENIIESFKKSFFKDSEVAISTARAGNVIGCGDWSKDRIIPDAIKNWNNDEILFVRSKNATRPWQHVLEPLYGYMRLAEKTWNNPNLKGPYNFGPNPHEIYNVGDVISRLKAHFIEISPKIEFCKLNDNFKESDWLGLDNTKSKEILGISPVWNFNECVDRIANWYKDFYRGVNAQELCDRDIINFEVSLDD